MKNKSLLTLLVFSSLIIPTFSSAGMINEKVKLQGNISIKGSETLGLKFKSGKGIQLNKGTVDVEMETLENPISLLMPRLYIEQNGQLMAIKVPASKYLNADEFELKADSSGLNYDLLFEKSVTKSSETTKIEDEGCIYRLKGDAASKMRFGVQKFQNTYVTQKETYTLTLSKDNETHGTIVSVKSHSEKLNSKALDICK